MDTTKSMGNILQPFFRLSQQLKASSARAPEDMAHVNIKATFLLSRGASSRWESKARLFVYREYIGAT